MKKNDISAWPTVDPYQPTIAFDDKGNPAAAIQQAFASINSDKLEQTSLKVSYWLDREDTSCLSGTVVSEEI